MPVCPACRHLLQGANVRARSIASENTSAAWRCRVGGTVRGIIPVDFSDIGTFARTTEGPRIVRRLRVHVDIENKTERISPTDVTRYSSDSGPIMDVASGRLAEGAQHLTVRVLVRHE